jgi:hypothetical protein
MTMSFSQVRGMVDYRWLQSKNNKESLLDVLQKLNGDNKWVSSKEIEKFLRKKKMNESDLQSQSKFYNIEMGQTSRSNKESKRRMSLRTIQRHLSTFVNVGLVIKKNDKYFLSTIGKRKVEFRNFASGYGNLALNYIMNCHFPTVSSLGENIYRLVEIFGLYIVYCLNESARLASAYDYDEKDHSINFSKNGKFEEEGVVSSWIKDVFDPWRMLNLFLTVISNSSTNEKRPMKIIKCDNNKKQAIALEEYCKYYGEAAVSPNTTILSGTSKNRKVEGEEMKAHLSRPAPAPTTLDLARDRIISAAKSRSTHKYGSNGKLTLGSLLGQDFHQMLKLIINYGDQGRLLYELDNKKISLVKETLEKRYPIFCKYLQKASDVYSGPILL